MRLLIVILRLYLQRKSSYSFELLVCKKECINNDAKEMKKETDESDVQFYWGLNDNLEKGEMILSKWTTIKCSFAASSVEQLNKRNYILGLKVKEQNYLQKQR